jgi:hypothetical protein
MNLEDLFNQAKQAAIQSAQATAVTVRTNLNASSPITLNPMAPSAGPPNPIMVLLQPEFVAQTPVGPMNYAPYGPPSHDVWPTVMMALGFAAATFMGLGSLLGIPGWIVGYTAGGAFLMTAALFLF